ncbi:MAG: glycosyl hydrolase [Acidobacteriota bacterium]
MIIRSELSLESPSFQQKLQKLFELAAAKVRLLDQRWDPSRGSPVFTVDGRYTARGWTEWTQGFQFGMPLLVFDATGDEAMLELGRSRTVERMAPHLTHTGVHDHGFNNVSTCGNLLRLMNEGRIAETLWERRFYELALKVSGAVQAARWSRIHGGGGYIYSFNGPHSLFVDTIRSLRALAVAHRLGHALMGENDERISLLGRLVDHARSTARYSVYYGEGRDHYDVRGRVAHESVFNPNDGRYRCPNSQQGYSPFSTWTRGLAWAMLGFAEQLEFLETLTEDELAPFGGKAQIRAEWLKAAQATCGFYIENTAADGIPYWDTGAPELGKLGDWRSRPSDPFNPHEPVDSSAAAIAAQGLMRLGRYLGDDRCFRAGLTVLDTLLGEPYLSTQAAHEGLILHSVYHRPNGWDHMPDSSRVPRGESSMWGDYHALEAALYAHGLAMGRDYAFFSAAG